MITQKTRLAAKGFLHRKGIDFNEVCAHVAWIETIILVTIITDINNLPIHQMNVKDDFLNGTSFG